MGLKWEGLARQGLQAGQVSSWWDPQHHGTLHSDWHQGLRIFLSSTLGQTEKGTAEAAVASPPA